MKIALTGMIAAGKSTTLNVFRRLGWLTLQTDVLARRIALSAQGQAKAAELFGQNIRPDSMLFKERFVSDLDFKKSWESFIHPQVRAHWQDYLHENKHANVVVELPLVYENGLENRFDKVVVLTTSLSHAHERWANLGRSLELYQSLSKQLIPIDQKIKKADFVIKNDTSPLELVCQIEALHQKLINDNARRKTFEKRRRG